MNLRIAKKIAKRDKLYLCDFCWGWAEYVPSDINEPTIYPKKVFLVERAKCILRKRYWNYLKTKQYIFSDGKLTKVEPRTNA